MEMGWIIEPNDSLVSEEADPLLVKENYRKDENGWCQSLLHLPSLSSVNIESYFEETIRSVMNQGTKIKKHFDRGKQFLAERYIDPDYVFTKFNDSYFFIKVFALLASRMLNAGSVWPSAEQVIKVAYAFCECRSGNGGQCAH